MIVAAHNGGEALKACLASLAAQRSEFDEWIVVDDGSTDGSIAFASEMGARIVQVGKRRGPANARNLGALAATGTILLFLDADVSANSDTVRRVRERFEADRELGGVFGSYDADPAAPGLASQFRNLLHCFTHQTSSHCASTFWAGCGAIRREVFLKSQGFDVSYSVPCVEDIELGMRLVRDGVRIELDPAIQVKHLKRWTLGRMISNDIYRRGIPWMKLILASNRIPNDLNLRTSSRASVLMVALAGIASGAILLKLIGGAPSSDVWSLLVFLLSLLASVIAINHRFYRFLASSRSVGFALASAPLHITYFLCCGTALVLGTAAYCWSEFVVKARRTSNRLARQGED